VAAAELLISELVELIIAIELRLLVVVEGLDMMGDLQQEVMAVGSLERPLPREIMDQLLSQREEHSPQVETADRWEDTTQANPDPSVKEVMAGIMAAEVEVEVVIMAAAAERGPVAQGDPLIQIPRS
jgi:hypothetical protein